MANFKRLASLLLTAAFVTTSVVPVAAKQEKQGRQENLTQPPMMMWYDKPASDWENEGLPLGNGFMGAMVLGGVENDKILINEHTLWNGGPGTNKNYDGGHSNKTSEENVANLKKAQQLLQEAMTDFTENHSAYIDPETGKVISSDYQISNEVNQLVNSLKGDKTNFGSYQQLSNLVISDEVQENAFPIAVTSNSGNKDIQNTQGAEKIFDGNLDTKWFSVAGLTWGTKQEMPVWVMAEYKNPLEISGYSIVSGEDAPGRDPKNWTLYGSNDGETFEEIEKRENVTFESRKQTKTFDLGKTVSYKYYKFEISELFDINTGNGCQMQEVIFEKPSKPASEYTNYKRMLDMDNAIASVDYTIEDMNYQREYFVNNPDNVMAVRLTADKAGSISKYISLETPQQKKTITAEGDTITMTGQPSDHREDGLHFAQQVKVIPTGGTMQVAEDGIMVNNADEILILTSSGTNYQQCMDDTFDYFSDEDPLTAISARIANAEKKGYEQLKKEHIADYSKLFAAAQVNLGATSVPEKTTENLLAGYSGRGSNPNTAKEDRYLENVFFQYGRYLMIASSREGSLPANLQGIWSEGLTPPWDADYHTNINVQMNYWLAEQTNLEECHEPLLTYIKSLVPRGEQTAKRIFGNDTRGWTTFHENNIWGNTAPAVSEAFFTPTAAAWLCQDIWEAYAFNMDEKYLAENYDVMLQSALFLVDILVEDTRDNTLVVSPSYSPEHGPYSMGTTFDQAIVWDVFNNVILASEVLGKSDDAEVKEIKAAFERLSGPKIGLAGQFQEWKDETTMDITGDYQHRHVNHLYGLHPGKQIVAGRSEQDDAYVEAIKQTLYTRGGGGIGWSKAWKTNFWARLRDGDYALKLLEDQLKTCTLDNLFDNAYETAQRFQIDGNFGATSGVAEMLLQSQGDSIDLLAALPTKWANGSFAGLKARGNYEISAKWNNHVANEFTVKSISGGECVLRYDDLSKAVVTDSNGNNVEYEVKDVDTIAIDSKAGETYTITEGEVTREALEALINKAKTEYSEEEYLPEFWAEFQKAIAEAQVALDKDNSTQADIEKEYRELRGAIVELEATKGIDKPDDSKDIPIEGVIATAGSEEKKGTFGADGAAKLAIDGNEDTAWFTAYDDWNTWRTEEKGWLDLQYPEPHTVDGLRYLPAQNEHGFGCHATTKYEVWVKTADSEEYQLATSGDWALDSKWKDTSFEPIENVTNVRLLTKVSGPSDWWAYAAEVRATSSVEAGTEESGIDKTDLQAAVDKAKGLNKSDYTETTWAVLEEKLTAAEKVLTDKEATYYGVLLATENLKYAIDSLVEETGGSREEADKVWLDELIKYAESQKADEDYQYVIPVVKEAFEKALAEAIVVNGNADATQEEVDAAYDKLLDMVHYLEFTGNSESLKVLVDTAKGLNEKLYTPESWEVFAEALAKAEAVLADENALQAEIDVAREVLQSAMDSLERIPVDKSKLQKLVDKSKKYEDKIAEYTPATAEIFQGALDYAREVLANEDATQEEVDAAYAALQNAIFQLRLIPDKDKLGDLIKNAEKVDTAKYTAESAAVFKGALAKAKAVFADANATEEDVKAAEKDLKKAQKNLVAKADADDDKDNNGNGNNGNNSGKDNNGKDNNGKDNNGDVKDNGKDAVKENGQPKTGDTASTLPLVGTAVASGLAAVFAFLRKRK